ncbi:metallophosphoesterase family protein [Crocosphaera sp. XPORK-15E]|uniref:metallophosphoesterase family protein n=1 Tax=Crocosphaera sp. XPORK-15E TaxID=3110247 RepID=UPI002B1ED544|nr:metallophosphoesterase family protein [Crocosphaera sp. XPORK-15E]MEA5533571.1 metallophosphoesterase family protein [Crocosphaera sp. XPORK-15E]
MRTLAVGDIHGCSTAFDCLLDAVQLQPEDKLITLGDYVDKGPNSNEVLNRLLELYQNHQLIPLKGNHEMAMLAARQEGRSQDFWLAIGGKETLESYHKQGNLPSLAHIPDEHWDFIDRHCLDWYETDDHIFVHANLDPDLPLKKQSEHDLFWQKLYPRDPHYSGKTVICGHTSQKDGQPVNLGHQICLDTWACGDGWLSCLDVDTGKLWQTNQKGQVRTTSIDKFCNVPSIIN